MSSSTLNVFHPEADQLLENARQDLKKLTLHAFPALAQRSHVVPLRRSHGVGIVDATDGDLELGDKAPAVIAGEAVLLGGREHGICLREDARGLAGEVGLVGVWEELAVCYVCGLSVGCLEDVEH